MALMKAVKRVTQISINKSCRFISIPIYLVQKALKKDCEDIPRMFFSVSLLKNNGVQMVFVPSLLDNPKTKPFRGWKCNSKSKRYYISAVSILQAVKINKKFIANHTFPAKVEDGKIVMPIPMEPRQPLWVKGK